MLEIIVTLVIGFAIGFGAGMFSQNASWIKWLQEMVDARNRIYPGQHEG